jgi:hypothetical protein
MVFLGLSTWIRDRTFKHFTTPSLQTLLTLFKFQLVVHNSWRWNNVLSWRKNQYISLFDITPPYVSKCGIKKEGYAVNIQARISLRNKSPSAKHTVCWLLVCVFTACPVVLKLQKELSGKLYTVNRNKTISERTEYEAILTLDCYVYRVHASNSIISTKSLSRPILYSHIKQYGHHRVVVLMETAVVLHGGVLYEGIELYMF